MGELAIRYGVWKEEELEIIGEIQYQMTNLLRVISKKEKWFKQLTLGLNI